MKRRLRIAIYSLVYLFVIVAFFGISNGLGWDIQPEPRIMAFFIALYVGGLVPMWKAGSGPKEKQEKIVDWDKEMERRRKMGAELQRQKAQKRQKPPGTPVQPPPPPTGKTSS